MYRGTFIDSMGRKRERMGFYELPDGRMTLGGDVIEASKKWVLKLPVTGLKARGNNLIIYVDG